MTILFTDKYELAKVAKEALKKIHENKAREILEHEEAITPKKIDYSMHILQEYTDLAFEKKVKTDAYIYKKFISQLQESQQEEATLLLGDLLDTVKQIYEFINIEPKIHGFKNVSLEDSESSLIEEANRLILDFFTKNYYSLTESQRAERYRDLVTETSYELMVTENLSLEESVKHSYKSLMLTNFIKNVNFPYLIENKIHELMESDMYNEIFESDKLFELVDQFKEKSKQLSRVFSFLI